MTDTVATESLELLKTLEVTIDASKTSKNVAALAACALLVSISERLTPAELAIFADMIQATEGEIRHKQITGTTH